MGKPRKIVGVQSKVLAEGENVPHVVVKGTDISLPRRTWLEEFFNGVK